MTVINGASVWEQQLYDHVTTHGRNEGEILAAYEQLANDTESPAFAFLAQLILDDERRHHQLLDALATTIRTTAELSGEPVPSAPGASESMTATGLTACQWYYFAMKSLRHNQTYSAISNVMQARPLCGGICSVGD